MATLTGPPLDSLTNNRIDLHKNWALHGHDGDVAANLKANPPAGLRLTFAHTSGVLHTLEFAPNGARPGPHGVQLSDGVSGSLQVSVISTGPDTVALRADAVTYWTRTRTTADNIPPGAIHLTISHPSGIVGKPTKSMKITDAATIKRVASLLGGLDPALDESKLRCAYNPDGWYELTFWTDRRDRPEATAYEGPASCGLVTVTIPGRKPKTYERSSSLDALLAQLVP